VPLPPTVLTFYSLPLGGSTTISTTYHFKSSSTVTVGGQPPTTTTSDTQQPSNDTIRFVRRESITVPAGKGFPLKRTTVTQGVTTGTETSLSLRFNGQPVTN